MIREFTQFERDAREVGELLPEVASILNEVLGKHVITEMTVLKLDGVTEVTGLAMPCSFDGKYLRIEDEKGHVIDIDPSRITWAKIADEENEG